MSQQCQHRTKPTALLAVLTLAAIHLVFWGLPEIFETWNARTQDRLFVLRANTETRRPPYDSTVVHIDLNDRSLAALQKQTATYYIQRADYARVTRNLTAAKVAAQAYDFIFVAPTTNEADRPLIEALQTAGNVYLGLSFRPSSQVSTAPTAIQLEDLKYLERIKWHVGEAQDIAALPATGTPTLSFPQLADAARGLGYLNAQPDRDGVYRRIPAGTLRRCPLSQHAVPRRLRLSRRSARTNFRPTRRPHPAARCRPPTRIQT